MAWRKTFIKFYIDVSLNLMIKNVELVSNQFSIQILRLFLFKLRILKNFIRFRFLIQNWKIWRNTYINIYFLISFRKLSLVVPNKIYRVLTKHFISITVEVKSAFIQMSFWADAYDLKKAIFPRLKFWKVPCWLPSCIE